MHSCPDRRVTASGYLIGELLRRPHVQRTGLRYHARSMGYRRHLDAGPYGRSPAITVQTKGHTTDPRRARIAARNVDLLYDLLGPSALKAWHLTAEAPQASGTAATGLPVGARGWGLGGRSDPPYHHVGRTDCLVPALDWPAPRQHLPRRQPRRAAFLPEASSTTCADARTGSPRTTGSAFLAGPARCTRSRRRTPAATTCMASS
jgi:hypothetical protein